MTKPVAYEPLEGQMFQIFARSESRVWESIDYADSIDERIYLMDEYRLAYGGGWEFKYIKLPRRFWKKAECKYRVGDYFISHEGISWTVGWGAFKITDAMYMQDLNYWSYRLQGEKDGYVRRSQTRLDRHWQKLTLDEIANLR